MIQKLRKKFIIINMTLVSLVLIVVLCALCLSNYQKLQSESLGAMRHALSAPPDDNFKPKMELNRKKDESPFNNIRIFIVILNESGTIDSLNNNGTEVTKALAQEAVTKALETGKDQGNIKSLALRYIIEDTADGRKIAFADTISQTRSMQTLILNSLLILIAGMAAFFIISLFLSKWALKPVEKAWAQQNQFIADASHELKTPLTVILANLKILLTHKEDTISNQSRWIENTHTEATRMKELVENLLFLARSESDTVTYITGSINLSDTVWKCLLPFESIAFEQGITIRENIAPSLYTLGNEGQLKQLMAILLDNACKYADRDKQVTVTLSRDQEKAVLSVNNTGEPVPQEELDHIFERFYRSDKSRVRTESPPHPRSAESQEGGYGLGLSIAQTIVQSHHGKISVQSAETIGTTFTVTLPLYASKNI